ncbi:probable steroid-binding protein 3 [Primulina eburnea]|uniref:probable steroid-binding protein 3 n=1 Tax=Primulina eburnea TaxID=1245227 RepID=UPI003C6C3ADC
MATDFLWPEVFLASRLPFHSRSPNPKTRDQWSSLPQQLKNYDGTDPSKPIYVAIRGRIFDVTTGKSFYGPGGAYCMFAGKDASRALAKMSKEEHDVVPSLDGLTDKEIGVLNDWEKKFEAKYPIVGRVSSA